MKSIFRIAVLSVAVLLFVFSSAYAETDEAEKHKKDVTITGIVSENFQIITDKDEIIEIGDSAEGDEVTRLVGAKVKVKGTISTYEETRFITIDSFEVLE